MNVKKLWIAVLLGMLLVLSLAGEAGARDRAAVSARKYITIPAGHFHPLQDGYDWANYGSNIYLVSGSHGSFLAPVVFPGSGPVTVRKVILYAKDNNVTHDLSVTLYKTNPVTGSDTNMANTWSGEYSPDIREFTDTTITYATIQRTHGAYLRLYFDAYADLTVYGVKIAYTD
jgi:hypothetical protein